MSLGDYGECMTTLEMETMGLCMDKYYIHELLFLVSCDAIDLQSGGCLTGSSFEAWLNDFSRMLLRMES